MSVSLYQPYIKNEDLKRNFNPLKWPRVCIDPFIWNCTLKNVSDNPVASWSEIPFSKSFKDKLIDLILALSLFIRLGFLECFLKSNGIELLTKDSSSRKRESSN